MGGSGHKNQLRAWRKAAPPAHVVRRAHFPNEFFVGNGVPRLNFPGGRPMAGDALLWTAPASGLRISQFE